MSHFEDEIAYERACRDVDAVCVDERNRRTRLQTLFLEEQNAELNACLEDDGERIEELESFVEELQNTLGAAMQGSEETTAELRLKNREVDGLKVGWPHPCL